MKIHYFSPDDLVSFAVQLVIFLSWWSWFIQLPVTGFTRVKVRCLWVLVRKHQFFYNFANFAVYSDEAVKNASSNAPQQDIGDWVLKRDHDSGRRVVDFSFPSGFTLEGSSTIKIWAKGARPASSSEPECRFPTWGFGSLTAVCTLSSSSGEVRHWRIG